MAAGADVGIAAYGLEAMGMMRIEKGHVAGNEINGQTTARDLGLAKMMSTRKDYIGRALASRPGLIGPDRWGLVGLKPMDREARIVAGAHLLPIGEAVTAANDLGYVTSAAFSPALGHWIGPWPDRGRHGRGRSARAAGGPAAQHRTRRRSVRARVLRPGRRAPPWLSLDVQHRSPLCRHGSRSAASDARSVSPACASARSRMLPRLAIIARKGRSADVAAVLSRHVGSPVLDAAKRAAGNGLAISGMGPGQWLAMAQSTGCRRGARCAAGGSRWPGRSDRSGRRARDPGDLRHPRARRFGERHRGRPRSDRVQGSETWRRRARRTSACRSR